MDKLTAAETEAAELKNLVDDLEYELGNAKTRVLKLDCRLSDATQKLKTFQEGEITVQGGGEGVSKNKVSAGHRGIRRMKMLPVVILAKCYSSVWSTVLERLNSSDRLVSQCPNSSAQLVF